ncbi:MAG: hypothetical protein ACXU8R_15260, partial [Xanthobacteraceae bacterium]
CWRYRKPSQPGQKDPQQRIEESPSAEDRLPKSLRFAESDVIIFVVRASGVHELGYGHKWDWEA